MTSDWHDEILTLIPSINGEHLLARMLPTLRVPPSTVLVLDQGSTDGTAAVCAAAGVEVVQLGTPHTYTRACNIGAELARRRGCRFILIANNDITFETHVLRELWEEMQSDPKLGVVAPSQVVVEAPGAAGILTSRVYWRLDRVSFGHDARPLLNGEARLDADFCELTCALVRLDAFEAVGSLDDDFGFYHEDADLGFRLRAAGWGCAYLPQSQIRHYSSSTINRESLVRKEAYLKRNRELFARKHLGLGVRIPDTPPVTEDARTYGAALHRVLENDGLLDEEGPELHIGDCPLQEGGYAYLLSELAPSSGRSLESLRRCRAVLTWSAALSVRLRTAGVAEVHHIPLGVETDTFNPWVPAARLRPEWSLLALLAPGEFRSAHAVLAAWARHVSSAAALGDPGWLILYGPDAARHVSVATSAVSDSAFRTAQASVSRFSAARVEAHEPGEPLTADERARLFRSVDAAIHVAVGEATPLHALEAMACGTPTILGENVRRDVVFGGAITYPMEDQPHEGFPIPSIAGMAGAITRVARLDTAGAQAIAREGLATIRARHTLRHSVAGIRAVLAATAKRDPSRHLRALERTVSRGVGSIDDGSGAPTPRLSGRLARRVRAVGYLAAEFGAVWEERGLRNAGGAAARSISGFAQRRLEAVRPLTARRASSPVRGPTVAGSALLIGYIDAQLGLGQSLRGLARALATKDVPFAVRPVGLGVEGRRGLPFMAERIDEHRAHAVNIIEVTGDELPRVMRYLGAPLFASSRNILRTYWELGRAPEAWRASLAGIHEIWAPNNFVADAFRSIFDGPISVVPPCVDVPVATPGARASFGLEEDAFLFLFSFDYHSFPQRKNPLAAVRAFRTAFPGTEHRVGLVVKATGADNDYPALRSELRAHAAYDPRITIIDESLPPERMHALLAASDAYVSLHRSEGFGFGMAEALALGKPVVGTGYSANAEFLTERTGYPVPYTLRAVGPDDYVHPEGQVWADPDESAAAGLMRRIVENPAEALARGAAGRDLVLDRFGVGNVGRIAAARLRDAFAAAPR